MVTAQPQRRRLGRARLITLIAIVIAIALVVAFFIAGRTRAGDTAESKSDDSLTVALQADMQSVDPDNYFGGASAQVFMNLYEGLLRTPSNAADTPLSYTIGESVVEPALAESWEVSADALTYTFHLREGVTFHDGTPMTSEAWKLAFERRARIATVAEYMVKDVTEIETPDPLTFVVTLDQPVNAFLAYMASPYAPRAISPAALEKYAADDATEFLGKNAVGTGAYRLTEYVTNDHYTLEAFDDYWGGAPAYKTITVRIIPDIGTQKALFNNGELDMITSGLPPVDIENYADDKNVTVTRFANAINWGAFVNPRGAFGTPELRVALGRALDKDALAASSFGATGEAAVGFYPPGLFPSDSAPAGLPFDPSVLEGLAPQLAGQTIDIGYGDGFGEPARLMANVMRDQLEALGISATTRAIQGAALTALYEAPEDQRPDILTGIIGSDALHPDTTVSVLVQSDAAPLNFFNYDYPVIDEEIDAGLHATNDADFMAAYEDIARIIREDGTLLSLVSPYDAIVTRTGITGLSHDPVAFSGINFATLRPSS